MVSSILTREDPAPLRSRCAIRRLVLLSGRNLGVPKRTLVPKNIQKPSFKGILPAGGKSNVQLWLQDSIGIQPTWRSCWLQRDHRRSYAFNFPGLRLVVQRSGALFQIQFVDHFWPWKQCQTYDEIFAPLGSSMFSHIQTMFFQNYWNPSTWFLTIWPSKIPINVPIDIEKRHGLSLIFFVN